MKTIEEARQYLERELSKTNRGSVEEYVYKNAVRLARGNFHTGFLLVALYYNKKQVEKAPLLSKKKRLACSELYQQIIEEMRK